MSKVVLPGQLRINDIIFDVPPTSIQIVKKDQNAVIPTLRSTSSTKIKTGKKDVLFIIDLKYPTGFNYSKGEQQTAVDLINRQLAPLIIQIRKCPFCSIENEKIRKEMAGELGELELPLKNMAGCIKSIRITSDLNSPELLSVQLIIKWFNYSPYSPYFEYLGDVFKLNQRAKEGSTAASQIVQEFTQRNNRSESLDSQFNSTPANRTKRAVPVDSPEDSDFYREFYTYGTTYVNTGKFINEVSDISNDIEIFYKEYSDAPHTSEEWKVIDSKDLLGQNVFSRYKSFKLSSDFSNNENSGALIPVNIELLLETNVPSISLLGQSTPTSQFLGNSDAVINISLFANAELKGKVPIESSRRFIQLSNVLENVYKNSIKFRPLSKRDPIFIKHPLVQLFQYNLFDNFDFKYINETGNINSLNSRAVLPVLIQSINTATVPEAPFCNRVDLNFVESYSRTERNKRLVNQGLGIKIIEELQRGLEKTIDVAGIVYNSNTNSFTSPTLNPSTSERAFLPTSINSSRIGMLSFIPGASKTSVGISDYDKLVVSLLKTLNQQTINNQNPKQQLVICLNNKQFENDSQDLFNKLIKYTISTNPLYLNFLHEDLLQVNQTSPNSTYSDMLLPLKSFDSLRREVGENPDFYWLNYSDTTLPITKDSGLPIALKTYSTVYEQRLTDLIDQETVESKLKTNVRSSKAPPPATVNGLFDSKIKEEISLADASKPANHVFGNFEDQGLKETQSLTLTSALYNLQDTTYTMRRAMPTFKLYFLSDSVPIERSELRDVWLNYEDFFNINSVKDIRLIKNKEIAADTLIINIANIDGDLVNTDFPSVNGKNSYGTSNGELITEKKLFLSPFKSFDNIMLNEGTRIQLRLGYDSDPDNLSIEFNGRVTQISGSDMLEIVAQSHAIELEQDLKGLESKGDEFSYNAETNDLVSKLLFTSNEVQNFGSRGINNLIKDFSFGGRFLSAGFVGGVSISDNLFIPPLGYNFGDTVLSGLTEGAKIGGFVAPFLGPETILLGAGVGSILGAMVGVTNILFKVPFTIYHQTIWEVLKELELRHPDCICSVVPYDNRMTIFFGYPEQLYFYRDFKSIDPVADKLEEGNIFGQRDTQRRLYDKAIDRTGLSYADTLGILTGSSVDTNKAQNLFNNLKDISQYMKPFRNYHKVSATHDIIINNIRADLTDTFNAVKVFHPKSTSDINFDGSVGFEDYEETKTFQADDDIKENFIRTGSFIQHNAIKIDENVNLPDKYALSILQKSLSKLYKGELVILGRPNIKPYDFIYIFDEYSGITGVVEVIQVIQHISYDTGWVTEIIPGMVIYTNNHAGRAQIEAIGQVLGAQYFKDMSLYLSSKFDLQSREDDGIIESTAVSAGTDVIGVLANAAVTKAASSLIPAIARNSIIAFKGAAGILGKTGAAAGAIAGGSFSTALALVSLLFTDDVITEIISWSKSREPLTFLPLKRNGKPWILGLYGLRPDSTIDSIVEDATEIFTETKLAFGEAIKGITHVDIPKPKR